MFPSDPEHTRTAPGLAALAEKLVDGEIAAPKGGSLEEIGLGIPATSVPARNTIFLGHALAWAEVLRAADVFFGANVLDYSGYP